MTETNETTKNNKEQFIRNEKVHSQGSILTRMYFKVLMYLLVTAGYFSAVAGTYSFADTYENCIPEDRNPISVLFQISPWWIPTLIIGGIAAFIIGVIFFLKAAGHVPSLKYPERREDWRIADNGDYLERRGFACIPIGFAALLYLIGMVILALMFGDVSSSLTYGGSEETMRYLMTLLATTAYTMIPWTAIYLSSLVINLKVGCAGHNTLVYICGKKIKESVQKNRQRQVLLRSIPDMKSRLRKFYFLDIAVDIICAIIVLTSSIQIAFGWVFFAFLIYVIKEVLKVRQYKAWADGFARIKIGAHAISLGHYDQKVQAEDLPVDEMQVATDLNSIGAGLDRAVDERLKSEHMQTELITNVSHDIRTPLTSIINYTDLLSKPDITPEQQKEYLAVLAKQSTRLKKLISDLIDASRAKSGKVELHPEKIDPATVITMMAGEYGERFHQKNIDLECTFPENSPARISADARQLGRVFENLFQNMLKYSLAGSRAYVDMEFGVDSESRNTGYNETQRTENPDAHNMAHRNETNTGNKGNQKTVRIIFRNISAAKLHISADELMQRFVRGDSSRSTEGSGLGLSIVRNLTELMGGTFRISIDGDLFKAILEFPEVEGS